MLNKNVLAMKKLMTFLLLVCGVASLNAQDLRVGPKIGINLANQSSDGSSPDSRIGIRGGGFVEIGVSDAFYIQPELLYSSKGSETSALGQTITTKINYLTVPIIGKYAFVNNDGLQVTAQGGPYVGFLLSAESNGNDISNRVKTLDIGAQIGAGLAYSVGPGSLTFDLRAGFGFNDINDSGTGSSTTNQVLPSATVGYAFSL